MSSGLLSFHCIYVFGFSSLGMWPVEDIVRSILSESVYCVIPDKETPALAVEVLTVEECSQKHIQCHRLC